MSGPLREMACPVCGARWPSDAVTPGCPVCAADRTLGAGSAPNAGGSPSGVEAENESLLLPEDLAPAADPPPGVGPPPA